MKRLFQFVYNFFKKIWGASPLSRRRYSSIVLADNSIRYYRLDEASGDKVLDSSGSGHDGTIMRDPNGAE